MVFLKNRSAARELALLVINHLDKSLGKFEQTQIEEIYLKIISLFLEEASSQIKESQSILSQSKNSIENYQLNHSDNLSLPVDKEIISVPLVQSSQMLDLLSQSINSCENVLAGIELFELVALAKKDEVQTYAFKLIQTYNNNEDVIKKVIGTYSKEWNINRLLKIDRIILSIAILEILLFEDIPDAVAIDEALILADRYSTFESKSFINGILGSITRQKDLILSVNETFKEQHHAQPI